MNLENDFFEKYEQITTIKPIPGALGLAKDGDLYWLYYVGMGETNYNKLSEMEQKMAKSLLQKKLIVITDNTIALPVYWENGVIAEIKFQVVSYSEKNL